MLYYGSILVSTANGRMMFDDFKTDRNINTGQQGTSLVRPYLTKTGSRIFYGGPARIG